MGELMTILAFGTLGAVSVLAYISARVTEKNEGRSISQKI